jgi:hypothetical protein
MNAFLKGHLTGVTPLRDLLDALDMVLLKHKQRATKRSFDSAGRIQAMRTAAPAETTAWSNLTRYAATHVAKELQQTAAYTAMDVTVTPLRSVDATAREGAALSPLPAFASATEAGRLRLRAAVLLIVRDGVRHCVDSLRRAPEQHRVDSSVWSARGILGVRMYTRPGRLTAATCSSCRYWTHRAQHH